MPITEPMELLGNISETVVKIFADQAWWAEARAVNYADLIIVCGFL